jgi:hypothetical protein
VAYVGQARTKVGGGVFNQFGIEPGNFADLAVFKLSWRTSRWLHGIYESTIYALSSWHIPLLVLTRGTTLIKAEAQDLLSARISTR